MTDFVAIDFETANAKRSSICSLGLVVVENRRISDRIYSLIKPIPNYYSFWTSDIHGLNFSVYINKKTNSYYANSFVVSLIM